jgi:hypothetical protein
MIIYIEIFSLLFAYSCGRHDVPPVDNFTQYGSNKKHQSAFHGWGFILKMCYVLAISFLVYWFTKDWKQSTIVFTNSTLIIGAVFDPVIAICRTVYTPPKKPWYYLTDQGPFLDRFLLHVLGKKAGIWKFLISIAIVIILTIFYGNHVTK